MSSPSRGSGPKQELGGPLSGGPYRIHVVAEVTGIPEPTLRAWERRYGIPSPERTAAGYRLYSLREVEQVRAMKAACDGGMSAAEAARSVRQVRDAATVKETTAQTVDRSAFEGARNLLLEAIERLDDEALETRLRQIMFLGNATTILDEVIQPTLVEVGRRWHAGEISIAHEHFASHRFATALRDLARLSSGSPGATPVLLAGFVDDEHELGLLGLAVRLGAWGLRPVVLGPRTPAVALRNAIDSVHPALVGLSMTLTPAVSRATEMVEDYAVACGSTPWIVGGPGSRSIADLIRSRGGIADPGDPVKLRAIVDGIVDAWRQNPQKGRK